MSLLSSLAARLRKQTNQLGTTKIEYAVLLLGVVAVIPAMNQVAVSASSRFNRLSAALAGPVVESGATNYNDNSQGGGSDTTTPPKDPDAIEASTIDQLDNPGSSSSGNTSGSNSSSGSHSGDRGNGRANR